MQKLPITAIVLTLNEEKNLRDCLLSVAGWVQEIIVVDSGSTDNTLAIAREFEAKIYEHPFKHYGLQRNWALELPIAAEWVFNLDADQRVTPELEAELTARFAVGISPETKGFLITRKTIFMGRWMRHGGVYPTYHAMMFRKGAGVCEDRRYDQHFVVSGFTEKLSGPVIDTITDSLTRFTERHNRWATLEAEEQLASEEKSGVELPSRFLGNPLHRRRALRHFYDRTPLFARSACYFIYRYIFRLGFLDGKEGMLFHFFQGLWYRMLVDAKIFEYRRQLKRQQTDS